MITDSQFLNNCGLKISYTDEKLTHLIAELVDKNIFNDIIKAIKLNVYYVMMLHPIEFGSIDKYLRSPTCSVRDYSEICIYEEICPEKSYGEKPYGLLPYTSYKFINGDGKNIYDKLSKANRLRAFL